MKLKRLDPVIDSHLFREAFSWVENSPRWFRESDAVFEKEDFQMFVMNAAEDTQVSFGVFVDDEFTGMILLRLRLKDVYEAHLLAKPKADVEKLARAAFDLRESLFRDLKAREVFSWVASVNKPVIKLCELCGMTRDGIVMLKGITHGKLIKWVRLSCAIDAWQKERGDCIG